MTISISSLAGVLALTGAALGQIITPQCVKTCQDAALSNGCAPTAQCVCNGDYQTSMLECLTKPSAQGGCSYSDITNWTNTVQTQCFQSPPILPPCLTICPLQAQQAANCSTSEDKPCVCSQTFTNTATSCLQQACPQQLADWQTTHSEGCGGSPSGSGSSSGSPTGASTTGTGSGSPTGSVSTSIAGTSTSTATTSGSGSGGGSNSATSNLGDGKMTIALFVGSMVAAVAAL
ncbi:hypothetical protein FRB91_004120 [Serendipita sp. 411]|nr:hypothetical protein FRB91_004120 [Serendipita sp. 411]